MAEATKDQLLEQIEQYKKDLTTANSAVDILTKSSVQTAKELATVKEQNAELQQQLTDERQRSGDLAADLNESENLTEELQKQLKRAETRQAESDTIIVSDGHDDYKVLLKSFKFKHQVYKAEELKDNETLVQELVAAGVGFLQKIEPKNEE
jgi:predicted  nucleic acid-binding Zn-ribbon protein